nr:hypothetical protein [uncultured Rhodopila sp.]
MEQIPKKKKRGGRVLGQTNLRTRALAAQQQAAIKHLAEQLTPDALKSMSSLDVLRICMIQALQSGDLASARAAASELAPFEFARKSVDPAATDIPTDLLPDPEPTPDEEAPANIILG